MARASTPTSWLLEKQPHLSQLLLYVNQPPSRVAFHVAERLITLRVSPDATHPTDEPETISIPLDCSIRMKPSASSSPSAPSSSTVTSSAPIPASLSVHKATSSFLLKLPIVAAPPTDDSSSSSFPTAAELRPAHYRALYCRQCGSAVLKAPPEVCLPLPSTFWSELVDLWYCHTEGNAKLDRLSASNVSVGKGRMLVGMEDVRVAMNDVHQDSVAVAEEWREEKRERLRGHCSHPHHQHNQSKEGNSATSPPVDEAKEPAKEAEEASDASESVKAQHEEGSALLPSIIYRRAHCSRCHCELGSAVSFSSPSHLSPSSASSAPPPPAVELHLLKHRISNVQVPPPTKDEDVVHQLSSLSLEAASASLADGGVPSLFLLHYTLETHVASYLLSLCQARCSFRFVLHDPQSSFSAIQLTLLNLDTSIQPTSPLPTSPSAASTAGARMIPVLKVAYELLSEQSEEEPTGEGPKTRKEIGERVEFGEKDLNAIERLLTSNSALLPDEFRRIGKQRLSFLRQLAEVT